MEGSDRGGTAFTPAYFKEDPDDARSHAVKLETTEFQVKEESGCGSRTDCVYAGHVVKDELVVGPESVEVRERNDDRSRGQMRGEIEISNPELNIVPGNNTFTDFLHHTAKTNTYTCETCGKTFLHKHDVMDHMKTHLRENSGKDLKSLTKESNLSICKPTDKVSCKICNKKVAKRYLKYHKRSHTGDKPYSCEICKKDYAVMSILKAHKLVHTGERPYSCDVCKKSYFKSSHLTIHKRNHTGEKPYICGVCKMGFTNMESLKTHIRIHTGEKPYECPFCGKRYRQWYALDHHKRLHTGQMRREIEISSPKLNTVPGSDTFTDSRHHTAKTNTYICDTCGKIFLHKHDIIDHIKTHLRENSGKNLESLTKKSNLSTRKPADKVSCKICNKKVRKRYLKYHERSHTGDKPYSCEICKRDFAVASSLKAHKLVHTGERPYSCDVCKKSFNKKFHLILHKRSHTGEKPYTCEVCKKGFAQMINLKTHIRVHTGERPYQCPFCEKRYCQQSGLENHKRLHIGEKLYACEICEQRFTHSRALNSHKFIHTNEKQHIPFSNDEFEKQIHKHKVASLEEKLECESSADLSRVSETGASTSLCAVSVKEKSECESSADSFRVSEMDACASLYAVSVNDKPECGSRADACGVSETGADVAVMVELVSWSENTQQPHIATLLPGQMHREIEISSPKFNTVPGSDTSTDLHHTAKTNTYICDTCGKTFLHKHDIIDHIKTHLRENSGKNLESLTKKSNLSTRKPADKVSCKICNKKVRKRYLKYHERSHTGDKPYSCEICKRDFAVASSLKAHKLVHTGERPYSCDVCKKSFNKKFHLILHKRSHTGEKPYTCEVCKKDFAQMINLKRHIRVHTGERPYQCPFCEKRYCQQSGLENHKRLHIGEKLYACEICEQRFTNSRALSSHKFIHTNEKKHIPLSNDEFEKHIHKHKVVSLKEKPECESSADLSRVSETGASTSLCAVSVKEKSECESSADSFKVSAMDSCASLYAVSVNDKPECGSRADACGVSETDADVEVMVELVPRSENTQQPHIATILPGQLHREIVISSPKLNTVPGSDTFTDFLHDTAKTNTYICDTCGKTLLHKHDIIDHIKTHLRKNSGKNLESLTIESNLLSMIDNKFDSDKVSCEICNKKIRTRHLKLHERTHTGEKPYTCGVCKMGFAQKNNLKAHIRIHTGERPYECPFCEKRFCQQSSLERHKRRHTGDKPYSCEICGKDFTTMNSLKTHKLGHTGERPYSCDVCKKSFTRSSHLILHKRTHTGEKPYTCGVCKKGFARMEKLKMHIRIHTGEMPYECPFCGKRYSQRQSLEYHKRLCTGEKPSSSTLSQSYPRDGEKPYVCEICEMRFTHSGALKSHKIMHTKKKKQIPFSCQICNKNFNELSNFEKHKQEHAVVYLKEDPECESSADLSRVSVKGASTSLCAVSVKKPECESSADSFRVSETDADVVVKVELVPWSEDTHKHEHAVVSLKENPECESSADAWGVSETGADVVVKSEDAQHPDSDTILPGLRRQEIGISNPRLNIVPGSNTFTDILQHTEETNIFACDTCAKTFQYKHDINDHVKTHMRENSGKNLESLTIESNLSIRELTDKASCEICNKEFTKKYLKIHKRIHTGEKPYTCGVCKKGFTQMKDLKTHIRIHTGERPYECQFCDKAYTRRHALEYHKRLHTGEKPSSSTLSQSYPRDGEKPYACEICNKNFNELSNFEKHKQEHAVVYLKENPECESSADAWGVSETGADVVVKSWDAQQPDSDTILPGQTRRETHLRENSGNNLESLTIESNLSIRIPTNKVSCEICNKKFRKKYLKIHQRTHTGEKPYTCGVCKKGFARMEKLKMHIRIHTGEKPYECPFCGKRYPQWQSLDNHKRVCTAEKPYSSSLSQCYPRDGEKPYACEICEMRFTHSGALKSHKIMHTKKKKQIPFSCQICNKNFNELSNFEKHKLEHAVVYLKEDPECESSADLSRVSETGASTSPCAVSVKEKPECESSADSFRVSETGACAGLYAVSVNECGSGADACGVSETDADVVVKVELVPWSEDTHKHEHAVVSLKENPECESSADAWGVSETGADVVVKSWDAQQPDTDTILRGQTCREIELPGSDTFTDFPHDTGKTNTYTCDTCGQTFLHKHDIIDHIKTHLQENSGQNLESFTKESLFIRKPIEKFPCKICKKKFKKNNLKIHERFHTGAKPYSCEVCKKGFAVLENLKLHKRVHTEERPYSCDVCKKRFSRSTHLKLHKRSHTGEKPYIINLKTHIRIHTGERPYECPFCEKRYSQQSGLEKHKRLHTGEAPYACEICKMKFTHPSGLNRHKVIHTKDKKHKPFSCQICNKNYKRLSDFEKHKHKHKVAKSNTYTCNNCGKTFLHKHDIIDHIKTHMRENSKNLESLTIESNFSIRELTDKVSCEICNKKFRKKYLKIHERIHTGEKPYTCVVCKRGFARMESLKSHMRNHTGEMPYECPFCGKRYKHWSALDNHKRVHTGEKPSSSTSVSALSPSYPRDGEKPYACETCEMKFTHSGALKSHKIIHTKDEKHKPYSCQICYKNYERLSDFEKHKHMHEVVSVNDKPECGSSAVVCGVSETGADLGVKADLVPTSEGTQQTDIATSLPATSAPLNYNAQTHTPSSIEQECISHEPDTDTQATVALKQITTKKRPYTCDICHNAFTQSGSLATHKRIHTGEKPYTCEVCNKKFTALGTLNNHKKSVHLNIKDVRVACKICNKNIAKGSLKYHERIHSGELRFKPYACEVCKKAFFTKGDLKAHQQVHSEERPRYTCDVCQKRFLRLSTLAAHVRKHT